MKSIRLKCCLLFFGVEQLIVTLLYDTNTEFLALLQRYFHKPLFLLVKKLLSALTFELLAAAMPRCD